MGVAAITKFADLPGSRQAMQGFGVPARFASALGLLLPVAESVVALLLLITPLAWWGALGALLVLLTFLAGISINLMRGNTPPCHCFGQLHSAPIGWSTLARNAILALVAAWIVLQGTQRVASGMDSIIATPAITWLALVVAIVALVLVAIEGWFLLNLLQQNGRLMLRLEALEARPGDERAPLAPRANARGLAVGTPAPAFSLAGLHGETLTLDSLRAAQKPLLLLFVDPNCGPCKTLLPDLARWQNDAAAKLTVVPITRGNAAANQTLASYGDRGLQNVLLQKDFEVAQSYQVVATPSALLVHADGTIGSLLAEGVDDIRALVNNALAPARLPPHLPILNGNSAHGNSTLPNGDCGCGQNGANGNSYVPNTSQPRLARRGEPAPAFQLPDLTGKPLALATFKGKSTVVLFWNPNCGYCRQMLDDLQAWESNPPPGAPQLLVVSTGSIEANQAQNLHSPTVLDTDFTTARAFGVRGTPSAILIDTEGRIASDVAAGREAVLALARGEETLQLTAART